MTSLLTDALKGAAEAVARRADVPLSPADAATVADAISGQMPAPRALEPLWPQLVRYGVSMLGTALAAHGIGDDATWQAVAGGIIALAPPVYRIVTTWLARRRA
ncbi:MAG: hypothetical protein AB1592_19515 [Pseudomonadota bacterium]